MQKRITAIAFEFMRDKANAFPVIRAMSEIAGSTSIFIAAEYLADPESGRGKMFGGFTGIRPSEVVIIGAGVAGLTAGGCLARHGFQVKWSRK